MSSTNNCISGIDGHRSFIEIITEFIAEIIENEYKNYTGKFFNIIMYYRFCLTV